MMNINNIIRLMKTEIYILLVLKYCKKSLQSPNIAARHATVLTTARAGLRSSVRIWQTCNEWTHADYLCQFCTSRL